VVAEDVTHDLTKVLAANQKLSYQDLLVGVREILRGKYSQKPQLASSHPMVSVYLDRCCDIHLLAGYQHHVYLLSELPM